MKLFGFHIHRCDDPWAPAPPWAVEIRMMLERLLTQEREDIMALKATDQALITEIHRNTDVAKAATLALTTLQGNVTDLTQNLADAIANSDASDDDDVKKALDELKANNDSQVAATPVIAQAVANTDPNAPPPTPPG